MKFSILFDMDGVLVDSEPVILMAAIMGLKEYGVNSSPDDFKPFIGAGEDKYIGGVAEKYGIKYVPEMKKRVYDIYDKIVLENIKVIDGAKETLNKLKEKDFKMALASSADLRKIKSNLKAADISSDLFDAIVSGDDVENKKPYPDIYLYAASKINERAESCIVVEDALNGVKAAKAAGMRCIAVETSFKADILSKENPNYICTDLHKVYDYIIGLSKD